MTDYYFKTDDLPALRELGVALGFLRRLPSDGYEIEQWIALPGHAWRENVSVTKNTGKMLTSKDGTFQYPERVPVPGIHCNLRIPQVAEFSMEGELKAELLMQIAMQRMQSHPEYAETIQAALDDFSRYFVLGLDGLPVDPDNPQEVFL